MWKRGEIAPKEQFLLFSTLFYIYISNFRSQITYSFVKCVVQFIVFLTLSTLICRGTDISKCFSESLGIRDNESRLYIFFFLFLDWIEKNGHKWISLHCITVVRSLRVEWSKFVVFSRDQNRVALYLAISKRICNLYFTKNSSVRTYILFHSETKKKKKKRQNVWTHQMIFCELYSVILR